MISLQLFALGEMWEQKKGKFMDTPHHLYLVEIMWVNAYSQLGVYIVGLVSFSSIISQKKYVVSFFLN